MIQNPYYTFKKKVKITNIYNPYDKPNETTSVDSNNHIQIETRKILEQDQLNSISNDISYKKDKDQFNRVRSLKKSNFSNSYYDKIKRISDDDFTVKATLIIRIRMREMNEDNLTSLNGIDNNHLSLNQGLDSSDYSTGSLTYVDYEEIASQLKNLIEKYGNVTFNRSIWYQKENTNRNNPNGKTSGNKNNKLKTSEGKNSLMLMHEWQSLHRWGTSYYPDIISIKSTFSSKNQLIKLTTTNEYKSLIGRFSSSDIKIKGWYAPPDRSIFDGSTIMPNNEDRNLSIGKSNQISSKPYNYKLDRTLNKTKRFGN